MPPCGGKVADMDMATPLFTEQRIGNQSSLHILSRRGTLPGEWTIIHKNAVSQIWMQYEVAQGGVFDSADNTLPRVVLSHAVGRQFGSACSVTRVADRLIVCFSSTPFQTSCPSESGRANTQSCWLIHGGQ